MYFVIATNEDGEAYINEITEEELKERLGDIEYWYGVKKPVSELPDEWDLSYWGQSVLVIKGEIVTK